MADHRPVETVAEALRLLQDPAFQAACGRVFTAHYAGQFSDDDLLAFFDAWGIAPPRNEGLYKPEFRHQAASMLAGRWGLILIWPETTESDVRAELRRIQRIIGKRHRDSLARLPKDARARWLEHSGFRQAEIAAALYGRTRDARRPTKEQIHRSDKALARVDALVTEFQQARGIPRRLAVRRAYALVQGREGKGAGAARAAARRADQARRALTAEIQQPRAANALTAAITHLLRVRFDDVPRAPGGIWAQEIDGALNRASARCCWASSTSSARKPPSFCTDPRPCRPEITGASWHSPRAHRSPSGSSSTSPKSPSSSAGPNSPRAGSSSAATCPPGAGAVASWSWRMI